MTDNKGFHQLVRSYLTIYLPRQKAYSPNTIKAYSDTINLLRVFLAEKRHVRFTDITFSILNKALICEYLDWIENERGCSTTTRNHRLAILKAFYKYAAVQHPSLMASYTEIAAIPVKRTVTAPVAYLSERALRELIATPDASKQKGMRDRFAMIFLYETGARIQELLDVRIRDLSLGNEVPFVYLTGKGRKTRAVPLQGKTISHLNKYLQLFHPLSSRKADDHLFYTVVHGIRCRMSEDNVAAFLSKYAARAKVRCPEVPERVFPHLFRHTKAMHLYQAGIPLSYIKDFLGHANVSTTDRYAFADVSMMRKALDRVSKGAGALEETGNWEGDEDMILRLCGLK
ncbi:MAG: tyrosine-type recombinase/integrase [Candidatus Methanomethylophilaceae archaeon]|nr:tyrosine-type recombinase/integrase [Candidatus Methanomethylophilaceae archaeon]